MPAAQSNRLLDVLSPESRNRILAVAKLLPLPVKTPLFEAGEPLQNAYFITSGIASVVIELAEGGSAEVALVGREGMVGAMEMLGPALAPSRCFIQMEASGYQVPAVQMKKIFLDSAEIRGRVLEMVQQQGLSMSQLAACDKLHEAEPRMARWLLTVQDRVQSDHPAPHTGVSGADAGHPKDDRGDGGRCVPAQRADLLQPG